MFTIFALSVEFIKDSCKHSFETEQIQKFIHSDNQYYDLIFIEDCWADSFLMFGFKYRAPIAVICKLKITVTQNGN